MGKGYRKYSYNNKGFANFDTATVMDTGDPLTKRAVLFYEAPEGKVHKDSKGRPHYVDANYLETLVTNTNESLRNGGTIYLIQDHKKDDFNSVNGYLDSEVYLKEIDQEDVNANPNLKKLVGRLAIFADKVKVTGKNLATKIKEGIKFPNISVGLDMENMLIKEISTTVIPALANASLFMGHHGEGGDTSALTLDDALYQKSGKEENREKLHDLLDVFIDVVDNIRYLRDEDMKGGTRETYYQQALNDLMTKIADCCDIGPDPGYASQSAVQDDINRSHTYAQENGRPQITGYSDDMFLSDFTMDEMEASLAEFQERRRRGMGTGTKLAIGAGIAGGGILGTRAGIRGYQGYKAGRKAGKTRLGSLGQGFKKAGAGVKSDVTGAGKYGWKKAKQYGGSGWKGLKNIGKKIISV